MLCSAGQAVNQCTILSLYTDIGSSYICALSFLDVLELNDLFSAIEATGLCGSFLEVELRTGIDSHGLFNHKSDGLEI